MPAHLSGPPAATAARPQTWMLPSWPWTVRAVGIVCLLAAEVTNTAQLGNRFADWFISGILFVVIGAAEGVLAAVLSLRPSRCAYLAAIAVSVLTISLWLVGLPFGPDIGRSDALRGVGLESTTFQAAAAAAFLALAYRPKLSVAAAGRGRGGTAVATVLILATVSALAVLAYTPAHPATTDQQVDPASGHSHAH